MKIGILALQGDFERHQSVFKELKVDTQIVKTTYDLEHCQGLVIPGGESTTLVRLLKNSKLFDIIPKFGKKFPIFGTCAGLILLSKEIKNKPIESLGLLDITVERNAYGRQINSFLDEIDLQLPDISIKLEGVFIRAPKIVKIGKGVKVLGTYKTDIIAVEENHIISTTFHPELTNSSILHQYFVDKVRSVF